MESTKQIIQTFISHLKKTMEEDRELKDEIDGLVTKSDQGSLQRIFQHLDFHIPPDSSEMKELDRSYYEIHQKCQRNDANRFNAQKKYLCDVVLKNACSELINPDTGLLKDDLIKTLDFKAYSSADDKTKQTITEYLIHGYVLYFLSPLFLRLTDRMAKKDMTPLNFQEVELQIVKAENFSGIAKIAEYLEQSDFLKVHRKILKLAEHHSSPRIQFYSSRSIEDDYEKLLRSNEKIAEQVMECMGYYRALGESYTFAAQAFLQDRGVDVRKVR